MILLHCFGSTKWSFHVLVWSIYCRESEWKLPLWIQFTRHLSKSSWFLGKRFEANLIHKANGNCHSEFISLFIFQNHLGFWKRDLKQTWSISFRSFAWETSLAIKITVDFTTPINSEKYNYNLHEINCMNRLINPSQDL